MTGRNMKPKLIVFSGKIKCGKDTAVEHLLKVIPNSVVAECKESLHSATMALFGVPESVYWEIYNDRSRKETPNTLFSVSLQSALELGEVLGDLTYDGNWLKDGKFPLTIREAMIFTSECVMKPMFGESVFGERRADKLTEGYVYLDASFGFVDELQPAIDKLGQENILGIRINGRGEDIADSRTPLPDGLLENTIDIWNGDDVELQNFLEEVEENVTNFIYGGVSDE